MAVDKNLPAMLDEKAYTILVCSQNAPDQAPWTMVTKESKPAPRRVQAEESSMFSDAIPTARSKYVTNIPNLQPGMLVAVPVAVPVATRESSSWTEKHLGNVLS